MRGKTSSTQTQCGLELLRAAFLAMAEQVSDSHKVVAPVNVTVLSRDDSSTQH